MKLLVQRPAPRTNLAAPREGLPVSGPRELWASREREELVGATGGDHV